MDEPAFGEPRETGADRIEMTLDDRDASSCSRRQQPGTQAVVDVVIVVRDFVGQIGQLRLQAGLRFR